MKAVILAGGLGTRLSEETDSRPKPMVEIGGLPILWHILKIFSAQGVNDFIICCGYKGYMIKEYFSNYALHMSDVSISMSSNKIKFHSNEAEDWNVTLVDTGQDTLTGGRLKRVAKYLDDEEFFFTYGDGLADIDIRKQLNFHFQHGGLATVTAVRPPGRYGAIEFGENDSVVTFVEKPLGDGGWINGGFLFYILRLLSVLREIGQAGRVPHLVR